MDVYLSTDPQTGVVSSPTFVLHPSKNALDLERRLLATKRARPRVQCKPE